MPLDHKELMKDTRWWAKTAYEPGPDGQMLGYLNAEMKIREYPTWVFRTKPEDRQRPMPKRLYGFDEFEWRYEEHEGPSPQCSPIRYDIWPEYPVLETGWHVSGGVRSLQSERFFTIEEGLAYFERRAQFFTDRAKPHYDWVRWLDRGKPLHVVDRKDQSTFYGWKSPDEPGVHRTWPEGMIFGHPDGTSGPWVWTPDDYFFEN